jgi:D-alanyl-D-alanine carboxypeptidase
MKKFYVFIGLFICIHTIVQAQEFPEDLELTLQEVLDGHIADYGVKGVSATVIRFDESTWTGVSGTADGISPVDTMKLWHFTSQSKGLISVVVLQLHEEGMLSVDEPLNKYLPGLENANSHFPIKRFLNHTSGTNEIYESGSPLWNMVWGNRDSVWNYNMFTNFVTKSSNDTDPEYSVNNTNTVLLTSLIEKLTGNSAADEIKNRIFDPLGLKHSIIPTGNFDPAQINGIWSYNKGNPDNRSKLSHNSYLTSRVSWIGKIQEAAKFERALNSGKLLKPETMELFYQPAQGSKESQDVLSNAYNLSSIETAYGLGISMAKWDGLQMYGHGGSGLGYSASYHFPVENLTISLSNNCFGSELQSMILFDSMYKTLKSWMPSTSNKELSKIDQVDVTIYPNPVSDRINIRFDKVPSGDLNVAILDLGGRILYQEDVYQNFSKQVIEVHVPQSLEQGFYILRLNNSQKTITKPFILSR